MKEYMKPTIDVIVLQSEEAIACTQSFDMPKAQGNNGHGNGNQDAPGGSLYHNGAENNQGTKHNKGKK